MDGVPLAIEQARAIIKEGIPIQDFLGHFTTQYKRVMAHKPPRSAWDYEKNMPIISVFNMLLARLDEDSDAANILAFASCFGPRRILVDTIRKAQKSERNAMSHHYPWSSMRKMHHMREMNWVEHLGHDEFGFRLAMGQLETLCLLKSKRGSEGDIVSITLHDSVSKWRFETLDSATKERWIIAAASALSKCLP